MSYVIYNKETTKTLLARAPHVGCYVESYLTNSAAKAALTRLDKKGKLGVYQKEIDTDVTVAVAHVKEDFAIAEITKFRTSIEKMVTRRNAMTGQEFQESINARFSSSPSSENYWST